MLGAANLDPLEHPGQRDEVWVGEDRLDRVYLALSRATDGMQAFKVLVAPQKPADREKPVTLRVHEGTEWCYVLAGRLRLQLDDEVTILQPGEAAEFDTTRPHSMTNDGDTTLEILSLFSRQAERSHITKPTERIVRI